MSAFQASTMQHIFTPRVATLGYKYGDPAGLERFIPWIESTPSEKLLDDNREKIKWL